MNGAAVLEAAVEAKNGRLYVLDRVLTPASIEPVLPHRCDKTQTQIIKVRLKSAYFSWSAATPWDFTLKYTFSIDLSHVLSKEN